MMPDQQSVAPTTTSQEDITAAGQRVINHLWESTQSVIAKVVIGAALLINGFVIVALVGWWNNVNTNQIVVISLCLQFINITASIIITFYFVRTNHHLVGGVGPKTENQQR